MPFDVAMQKPHSRISGLESNHGVGVGVYHEDVATCGDERGGNSIVDLLGGRCSGWALGKDLRKVAVNV